MKTQNPVLRRGQILYTKKFLKGIVTAAAVLFSITLLLASCLNPIGFIPDLKTAIDAGGNTAPGDTSPADDPNLHPDPDKAVIVFKNLTGGPRALAAVFTVAGREQADIHMNISLGAGQEKSIILIPGRYDITITFDGEGSPITGTKVLLQGRVEYVYFYVGKDGSYKGGINVDSSIVYGDIDYSYYQDNENTGDNNDSSDAARPEEGDVSRDDYPRHKLPGYMRENYGLVWVHNMSLTKDLMKLCFDHYTDDITDGGALDAHWEMNPGPGTGSIKSIILRPGTHYVKGLWLPGPGDSIDPDLAGGVIDPYLVLKAGAGNFINRLYFYKGIDGKWHLTGGDDPSQWSPPYDNNDMNPAGAVEGGGGENITGEGQSTNEGGVIDTGNAWWDSGRNDYGILQVKNLSSRAAVDKVEFSFDTDPSRHYEMGRVSPRGDRSIILGRGQWNPITVHYTVNSTDRTKRTAVTINPLGLTGRLNYLYFYYNGTDYEAAAGDTPPDYYNDSDDTGITPGQNEGDSPGALNDSNRSKLGLLILRNLSPDVAVDQAVFEGRSTLHKPVTYTMLPGPAVKDQRSILLAAGSWKLQASYTNPGPFTTGERNAIVTAGQVAYMYFYKTVNGVYALSPSWPPNPDDAALGNADPGTVIGDDEGWLNVINNSQSGAVIDRVQYNNSGSWIDIAIPAAGGTIAPGNESDPDLVVLKGSWSFRFKIAVKQTYSRSVSKTIRAGQTADITYTDALDSDEPPDGFGTLKIVNDSSHSVYQVKYKNLTLPGGVEISADINIARGENRALVLPAPPGSAAYYTYTVKCCLSSGGAVSYTQEQVDIENQKITAITITDDTPLVTESGDDNKGRIRVYNNYDNYEARKTAGTLRPTLPLKFFKVGLKGIDSGTAGKTETAGGANPDDKNTTGLLNLWAGNFTQLDVETEGLYELWILWGNTIANDPGSLTLTKYGIYSVSRNTYRDIYIDLFSINTAEASAVTMRITHVGYPSAAGISQIQIWYGGVDPKYDDPGEGRIPARTNGSTNDTYIVYKNNDILYAGDYREWKLAPGKKYWARAHWPLLDNWVGTGGFNKDFTLVDLTKTATAGYLQFVYDDLNDQLKFFSDQAAGIKLSAVGGVESPGPLNSDGRLQRLWANRVPSGSADLRRKTGIKLRNISLGAPPLRGGRAIRSNKNAVRPR